MSYQGSRRTINQDIERAKNKARDAWKNIYNRPSQSGGSKSAWNKKQWPSKGPKREGVMIFHVVETYQASRRQINMDIARADREHQHAKKFGKPKVKDQKGGEHSDWNQKLLKKIRARNYKGESMIFHVVESFTEKVDRIARGRRLKKVFDKGYSKMRLTKGKTGHPAVKKAQMSVSKRVRDGKGWGTLPGHMAMTGGGGDPHTHNWGKTPKERLKRVKTWAGKDWKKGFKKSITPGYRVKLPG